MLEKLEIEISNTGHYTNSYIYYDDTSKEAIVIDPADKAEKIISYIEKHNLRLKYILLTHGHADHVLAVNSIIQRYRIKSIANTNEKNMLIGNITNYSNVFGLAQEKINQDDCIFLNDEDEVKIQGATFKMIHTPGHTIGSVCYLLKEENILFTGDTLFSNCFGRCDLVTASIEDIANSLVKLYKNYKDVKVYSGHGDTGIDISKTYESVREELRYNTLVDLNDVLN